MKPPFGWTCVAGDSERSRRGPAATQRALLGGLAERGGTGAAFDAFCHDHDAITATLRFAAAVGALAVTRKGAFAAMPELEEVQQLLQQQDAIA